MKAINGFSDMMPSLLVVATGAALARLDGYYGSTADPYTVAAHEGNPVDGVGRPQNQDRGTALAPRPSREDRWRMSAKRLGDGTDLRAELTHSEGEDDREDSHNRRKNAKHPGDGQNASQDVGEDQYAEADREDAGQDQPPLVVDLFAHPNGRDDRQDAPDHRPGRDDVGESDPAQFRLPKKNQNGDQAKDTENEQWPATLSGRLIAESGQEHGDAVDEDVDADKYHPGQWADEGEQPNDDEEDASDQ